MVITDKERNEFPDKYKWMYRMMLDTTRKFPSHLEVLAAILVMEKEDPTKLVELMKEMKDMGNE